MHFHVFPALCISLSSYPLTLFLDLTFEFIVIVAAIVPSILGLGPILMFACPLALVVAFWLVVAVVVVGGVVVVVALALVCLPLVVGVVFVCSVPIIVCTPLRLATLEVALLLVLYLCPILLELSVMTSPDTRILLPVLIAVLLPVVQVRLTLRFPSWPR